MYNKPPGILRLLVHRFPWNYNLGFLLKNSCVINGVETLSFAESVVFKTLTSQDEYLQLEPTFSLDYEQAQELIDSLWSAGLRPSEGSGSAGSLAATQRHLEDLRKLVFKKDYKKD